MIHVENNCQKDSKHSDFDKKTVKIKSIALGNTVVIHTVLGNNWFLHVVMPATLPPHCKWLWKHNQFWFHLHNWCTLHKNHFLCGFMLRGSQLQGIKVFFQWTCVFIFYHSFHAHLKSKSWPGPRSCMNQRNRHQGIFLLILHLTKDKLAKKVEVTDLRHMCA